MVNAKGGFDVVELRQGAAALSNAMKRRIGEQKADLMELLSNPNREGK